VYREVIGENAVTTSVPDTFFLRVAAKKTLELTGVGAGTK